MEMGKVSLVKILCYLASGVIAPFRIVKFGSSDGVVAQASAATDKLVGVSCSVGTTSFADGARLDIARVGVAEVEYGGNVTRGDVLTSDSNGKAITVTTQLRAAADVLVIGIAEESGVAGDIGSVLIAPSLIAKTYSAT
jgi:hypothetical protein